MFENIVYRNRLSRIQRKRRRIKREYKKDIAIARKSSKSHDEILALYEEEAVELDIIDSEIGSLVSEKLLEDADRLFLPRPDFNDKENWVSYNATGTSHLSAKAITELRERIQKKKAEDWQHFEIRTKVFVGVISALTGAIGAAIGLVAIWK